MSKFKVGDIVVKKGFETRYEVLIVRSRLLTLKSVETGLKVYAYSEELEMAETLPEINIPDYNENITDKYLEIHNRIYENLKEYIFELINEGLTNQEARAILNSAVQGVNLYLDMFWEFD